MRVGHQEAGLLGSTLESDPHRVCEEWGDSEFSFSHVTLKVLVGRGGFLMN